MIGKEIIRKALKWFSPREESPQEEDSLAEKRKYRRVAVNAYITTTLSVNNAFQEKIFMAKDINPEGIFLLSSASFPIGTILNLKVHTPTTVEPIRAEAKVVRTAKDEKGQVIGMGLVISRISEADKKQLLKHVYLAYNYIRP